MAHYGRDFTSGRYTRRSTGDPGMDYDAEFGRGDIRGRGGRGQGWDDIDRGFGGSRGGGAMDETWDSAGYGQGRPGMGGGEWAGSGRPRQGGYGGSGFSGNPAGYANRGRAGGFEGTGREGYGGYRGSGGFGEFDRNRSRGFGDRDRAFYDREIQGRGRLGGSGYEEDFGDRLRQGWNRLRQEARGWMGRGYDRGW